MSDNLQLSQFEFNQINNLLEKHTGQRLPDNKQRNVFHRLKARVVKLKLFSFSQYIDFLNSRKGLFELHLFIDRLTTHETYFFREHNQFEFLIDYCKSEIVKPTIDIWSAACSTGEEVFSLAMCMAYLDSDKVFKIVGTDVSEIAISFAKKGVYKEKALNRFPPDFKSKFCLKGMGEFDGSFTFIAEILNSVSFKTENLLGKSPNLQTYDVIFLRNILIYFDAAKQNKILLRVISQLRKGGLLFLGHSESLRENYSMLEQVNVCIYRKL